MTFEQASKLLDAHGAEYAESEVGGAWIQVLERFTQRTPQGVISGAEWVSLPLTQRAILNWLGY